MGSEPIGREEMEQHLAVLNELRELTKISEALLEAVERLMQEKENDELHAGPDSSKG